MLLCAAQLSLWLVALSRKGRAIKTSTNCCPLQAAKAGGPVPEEAVLLRVTRDFQNAAVERSAWQAVVFSHDTEHVAACSDEHRLYMWSLVGGTLEGILEFEGEHQPIPLLLQLQHPHICTRPACISPMEV